MEDKDLREDIVKALEGERLIWKSEAQMQAELNQRIASWKPGFSRDGKILWADGKFSYKGIYYIIRVLRYYNHTNKFTQMSKDRISDAHAVVEVPPETKLIQDLVYELNSEFLFHDTLHSYNDKQTIEEQIEECHRLAKDDIDNLLTGQLGKEIDERIQTLQKKKEELEKINKNG